LVGGVVQINETLSNTIAAISANLPAISIWDNASWRSGNSNLSHIPSSGNARRCNPLHFKCHLLLSVGA
jgi:hypothetical protein